MRQAGLFPLLLFLFSSPLMACGTADNWMDVYEGTPSGSAWRDASNRLEALTMLLGCDNSLSFDKRQQRRLARILSDAMIRKAEIIKLRAGNREIRHEDQFRGWYSYEGLVESIYIRFRCLPEAMDAELPFLNNAILANHSRGIASHNASGRQHPKPTLYTYFGHNACPGHTSVQLTVAAKGGARLRAEPKGIAVGSLPDGAAVNMLGRSGEWYRILISNRTGGRQSRVGYLHRSVVVAGVASE